MSLGVMCVMCVMCDVCICPCVCMRGSRKDTHRMMNRIVIAADTLEHDQSRRMSREIVARECPDGVE
jgi:hypothetical protein